MTSKHVVIHLPTWVPRLRLADRTAAAAVSLTRRLSLLHRSARDWQPATKRDLERRWGRVGVVMNGLPA